jgi:DNA-binding GntR family transcriptional regulator
VHSPRDEFVTEHETLIEEIAAGDPARARRAMIEHIAWGLERNVKGDGAKRRAGGVQRRARRPDAA